MENLNFRTITAPEDKELYLDKVEHFSGIRLPMAYANRSRIVGVYSNGTLVAGYMLVTKPMFRSLMFIPDSIRSELSILNETNYELMEVNGLWIGPGIKTPKAQFKVWLHLIKDIFLCKKKYLLLMSASKNKTIKRIHNLTNPTVVYEGISRPQAGESTHELIRVSYTTRWRAVLNFPKYLVELRLREERSKDGRSKSLFNETPLAE